MKARESQNSIEYRIGVDIGKTKLAAGVVNMQTNQVVSRILVPTDTSENGRHISSQLSDVIVQLIDSSNLLVTSIGIATFGLVDCAHGVAIGGKALEAYHNVPFRVQLHQRFGVPVRVENDVTAAAIAEYHCGLPGRRESMTLVSLGTSAGIATICNGHLLRGVGGRAGQIAHLPFGRRGIESIAEILGGTGIAKRALSLYGMTVNASEAFALATSGDERCGLLIDDWIDGVADLVLWIVCTLDPSFIILTGGVLQSSNNIVDRINSSAKHALLTAWPSLSSPKIQIIRSTLGVNGGIIGAALLPYR